MTHCETFYEGGGVYKHVYTVCTKHFFVFVSEITKTPAPRISEVIGALARFQISTSTIRPVIHCEVKGFVKLSSPDCDVQLQLVLSGAASAMSRNHVHRLFQNSFIHVQLFKSLILTANTSTAISGHPEQSTDYSGHCCQQSISPSGSLMSRKSGGIKKMKPNFPPSLEVEFATFLISHGNEALL